MILDVKITNNSMAKQLYNFFQLLIRLTLFHRIELYFKICYLYVYRNSRF